MNSKNKRSSPLFENLFKKELWNSKKDIRADATDNYWDTSIWASLVVWGCALQWD